MIFYFSGCGNSRFVAEATAAAVGDKTVFIPEHIGRDEPFPLQENEAVGLVFPIYAWAPARVVQRFIETLSFDRPPAYVYAIATYGDEAGYSRRVLANCLKKRGLPLHAFFGVQMPETYINLPGFALDTPEGEARKIAAARDLLPRISEAIRQRRPADEAVIGGSAWFKTYGVNPLFYAALISDRPFRVEEGCTSCGTCAKACPVENIRMSPGEKPQWQHRCVGCMACYHHCPHNAIQFGKATQGKGQYYFGHRP